MSPLPAQMVDRWQHRADQPPGVGVLYWHMLLHEHPQAVALAQLAQERLAPFAEGLHFTPLKWLHITTLVAGPAHKTSDEAIATMANEARRLLARTPPITVTLGRVLYHPQAIALIVEPKDALTPVLTAAQTATRTATGHPGNIDHQPWTPHVTLAYSTSAQPAAPLIWALGRELPRCEITINALHLVTQEGPERRWDWYPLATIPFGTRPAYVGFPS